MIKLNIAKGYLLITDENNQIYPGWLGETPPPDYPWLQEPSAVYQKCLDRGDSPERIIDVMLGIFHQQRFLPGFLAGRELVVGMVGPRGGGKSCGGSAIAIYDFMLAGVPVFSNMDIAVTVRYKEASKLFKTRPLDTSSLLDIRDQTQMYRNCLIFVDEANMTTGDSQRTMSNKALWFSYVLQQSRKRHMSLIHTEQSEYFVPERLRFQTNLYISCKDAAYGDGKPKWGSLGRKSEWKVHDYSGVVTGQHYDGIPIYEDFFHNTPFWHSFNTDQLQTDETEMPDFKKRSDISIQPGDKLKALMVEFADGTAILDTYCKKGEWVRVWKDKLWETLGISDDKGRQDSIGKQLVSLGAKPGQGTGGRRFYELPPLSDFD